MIDMTYDDDAAHAVVTPTFGRRVVFVVEQREVTRHSAPVWGGRRKHKRWVVALRGSNTEGFSNHLSFETACKALLVRANRYDRAYSIPRGLAAAS